MEVGVRELRNNLSRYLGKVQEGEEIVVTERGRAIARVVPLSGERKIDRLIAAGLIQPAPEKKRPAPPPRIRAKGTVSDLVAEQRR